MLNVKTIAIMNIIMFIIAIIAYFLIKNTFPTLNAQCGFYVIILFDFFLFFILEIEEKIKEDD